jgi:hypothetical protein
MSPRLMLSTQPSCSASQVLGLQMCTTMPSLNPVGTTFYSNPAFRSKITQCSHLQGFVSERNTNTKPEDTNTQMFSEAFHEVS